MKLQQIDKRGLRHYWNNSYQAWALMELAKLGVVGSKLEMKKPGGIEWLPCSGLPKNRGTKLSCTKHKTGTWDSRHPPDILELPNQAQESSLIRRSQWRCGFWFTNTTSLLYHNHNFLEDILKHSHMGCASCQRRPIQCAPTVEESTQSAILSWLDAGKRVSELTTTFPDLRNTTYMILPLSLMGQLTHFLGLAHDVLQWWVVSRAANCLSMDCSSISLPGH